MTRNQEIIAAYCGGETGSEVGARYGITRQRVSQILLRYGVETRHSGSEEGLAKARERIQALAADGLMDRHPDRNSKIVAAHKAGAGLRKIARDMGLSPGVVAGVLHRKGLTTEKLGRGNGVPAEIREAAAREAWASTYQAAADKYGVAASTVFKWANAS
jgi:lambda repressor-like predicted transcriptional regulator